MDYPDERAQRARNNFGGVQGFWPMYRGKLEPLTGYDSNRLAGFCTYFLVNLISREARAHCAPHKSDTGRMGVKSKLDDKGWRVIMSMRL